MEPIAVEQWFDYRLPLRRPWITGSGTTTVRQGRLLRLETADGLVGWGDAAPFPEIGIDGDRATAHARECAHLDLAAQRSGVSLATWLADAPAAASIAVNAVLGDLAGLTPAALQQAGEAGFPALKIKLGTAPPIEELARLKHLASGLRPGVRLRLDANGAWDEGQAAIFLRSSTTLPIESLEEPLRQPTPEALRKLQQAVPFALALDESLPAFPLPQLLAAPPVRRLILKPARQGGLLASRSLALQAREAGVECIFTSALESACGLLATAHLAAALAPQLAHGLATADWLAADTGSPPTLSGGRLHLPSLPGLGFSPWLS